MRKLRLPLPLQLPLLTLLLFVAACAGPAASPTPPPPPTPIPPAAASPTAPASPTAAPSSPGITLVDDEGTTIELPAIPQTIVSLTPATTEILFALGTGDRLRGRTDLDLYPPEATALPVVATYQGVHIEDVVDIAPDLVIAGGNNFTATGDVARLRDLGIPVLVV